MDNRICFMFGHAISPQDILTTIEETALLHYRQHNIRTFVVGCHGNFDRLAATAIKRLKHKVSDITLTLLLSYHPAERPFILSDGFDSSFYPPLETVPRRYAIVHANRYMVNHADSIICYVTHGGNSQALLSLARHREKKEGIPVENLGEMD